MEDQCFYPIVEVEVLAGTSIDEACKAIRKYADTNNCIVKFKFNGVSLQIYRHTNIDDIIEIYYVSLNKNKREI